MGHSLSPFLSSAASLVILLRLFVLRSEQQTPLSHSVQFDSYFGGCHSRSCCFCIYIFLNFIIPVNENAALHCSYLLQRADSQKKESALPSVQLGSSGFSCLLVEVVVFAVAQNSAFQSLYS